MRGEPEILTRLFGGGVIEEDYLILFWRNSGSGYQGYKFYSLEDYSVSKACTNSPGELLFNWHGDSLADAYDEYRKQEKLNQLREIVYGSEDETISH